MGVQVEHRTVDKPLHLNEPAHSSSYHVYIMTKGAEVCVRGGCWGAKEARRWVTLETDGRTHFSST